MYGNQAFVPFAHPCAIDTTSFRNPNYRTPSPPCQVIEVPVQNDQEIIMELLSKLGPAKNSGFGMPGTDVFLAPGDKPLKPYTDEESTHAGHSSSNSQGSLPLVSEPNEAGLQAPAAIVPCPVPASATTLMARNVPVMYTQDMLLSELQSQGSFDFIYLPHTGTINLSYAFINFTSTAEAQAFKDKWHKQRLAHFKSRKPLNISFAEVQGLVPNLLQLKEKCARRGEARQCNPVIILNREHLSLPKALMYLGLDGDSAGCLSL